ncbi:putative reverse transcriptase domain-containing protein [Tanacetum coccineum]
MKPVKLLGNKDQLEDFEEFNGGSVTFGGSKGYISGKGKIRVDKPNVKGVGYRWMFDIDYLTDSMNYIPVSLENQANPHAGTSEVTNNAGTSQTTNSKLHVEKVKEVELIVVPSAGRKKVSDGSTGLNEVDVNSGDSQMMDVDNTISAEVHEGTAQVHEGTAQVNEEVEDEAGPSTFQDESDEFIQDDTLIADLLVNISKNRRGAGITIPGNIPEQERPESPTLILDPKDKGKGIMKEEPKKKKLTLQQLRAAETANDEELTHEHRLEGRSPSTAIHHGPPKLMSQAAIAKATFPDEVAESSCTLYRCDWPPEHNKCWTWQRGKGLPPLGLAEANGKSWDDMKKMMLEEFCPEEEISRMEDELRNLRLRDHDIAAYTNRFNELVLLCPEGETYSSTPTTLNKLLKEAAWSYEQKFTRMEEKNAEQNKENGKWKSRNNQANAVTTVEDNRDNANHQVFPDDFISGLPSLEKLKFKIDLSAVAAPVARKSPYHIAPVSNEGNCLSKKNCWNRNYSPELVTLGAPGGCIVKKKDGSFSYLY